jgi:crooked neck
VREVYERAIANRPPLQEKRFWKRYIFLWINYAVYEELEAKDIERARQVWRACLQLVPHKIFTFSKVWIMAAQFEVRQKELAAARKLLGTALGKCPKEKLFKSYIELELQLVEIDRCRKIYEKYLEFIPDNCKAWVKYAELEASLQELERARAIFEMAVNQPTLDMPEMLWKSYIDFEIKNKAYKQVRSLYDRLLKRTKHVRVWISRAQFEASVNDVKAARKVFEDADEYFKTSDEAGKEERVMLVESWLDFETNYGSNKTVQTVRDRLPRRVKSKRLVKGEDGTDAYWEEYYDYIFPDEDKKQNTFKLLEMARMWKKAKTDE